MQKAETSDKEMTGTKNENTEAKKTYTCSMHPEVISDKPGKCPKCGMELIEKNNVVIQNIVEQCKSKQTGM